MRVLVTGGAGFIGSAVVRELIRRDHDVIVVDNFTSGRERNLAEVAGSARVHRLDVRTPLLLDFMRTERPEVVCHMAAQVSVPKSVDDPARDASVNVMGLLSVLESAAKSRVRKVVFASSGGAMYGEQRGLPVNEQARGRPTSPYGISKRVAEDYLRFYAEQRGLRFTSLALANVYGPAQDASGEGGVVARFAQRLSAGLAPQIHGTGHQTRDFVFVEDVARAFACALLRGDDETFNIGTGRETSINELYATMAAAAGFNGDAERAPGRAGDVDRSCLDASKAARILGWAPRVTLADGLKQTLDWFGGGRPERLLAVA